MAGQQRDVGPKLRFGHRAFQMVHETCADHEARIISGDWVVECHKQRAVWIVFIEDQVRVIAAEIADGLVPGGEHCGPLGTLQASLEEPVVAGAEPVALDGGSGADAAEFHMIHRGWCKLARRLISILPLAALFFVTGILLPISRLLPQER